MSLLDQHRKSVELRREDISRLIKGKAREQQKLADVTSKMNHASQLMSRTKSASTIQNRLREIERCQKEISLVNKNIANIESKIAAKQKALGDAEKKVAREEENELKKRSQAAEKLAKKNQAQFSEMQKTLSSHEMTLGKLQQLPEEITVLFFAANPLDWQRLRLDEEVRAITEMIRKARHRDAIKLVSYWAVQPKDILQALNEQSPAIVHFSGHGSDQDEIIFHDPQGKAKKVSKEAIVQTMMASSGSIRLVFFNTCYSRNQAEAVVEHVEATIGMNTRIDDEAARVFASQFYSAIGFGHSVKTAFEQAKAGLMMESIPEEDTPELFVHEGLDPETLILVRPNDEEN